MGGCPFHSGTRNGGADDHRPPDHSIGDRAIDRRDFVRTALAIGGSGALAAVSGCLGATDGPEDTPSDLGVPQGPDDESAFPERQHAWNRDLKHDPFGNVVLPNHQLLLFLAYRGGDRPTQAERDRVETALRTLERAFQRLTGGDPDGANRGLVFMIGYSPAYFDRFELSLPAPLDLQRPETVLRKTNDDPSKADPYDAVLLLSSDTVSALLASEEALFGELKTLNGRTVRSTLDGVFRRADRRTAFVGRGLPRERLENDEIHEEAPLSMGYKSGFKDNVASEDRVTISTGPFTHGSTLQISKLRLDLEAWYDNDRERRDELMFSHEHSPEQVGAIGEGLEADSQMTEEIVDGLESRAKAHGRVGHSAKTAQARDESFKPLILRRSEGVNNAFHEDGRVDFNFTAVMEGIQDFVETRKAMDSPELDDYIEEGGHGIVSFMEVTNRATFLLPPRSLRALPTPNPS